MTKIEVTFLGTTASIPTKYRNHPAIFLRYQSEQEHVYLFDCGEGTQRQITMLGDPNVNFMRINDIFISHWHADHFAGLFGLLETMSLEGRTRDLRIFAPEAEEFVSLIDSFGYSSKPFRIIPVNVEHIGTKQQLLLQEEEYQIVGFPVDHGIPAVGYAFVEKDRINIDKEKAKAIGLPEKGPLYHKLKEKGEVVFKDKIIKLEDISLVEKGKKVVYSGDTRPCQNVINASLNADLLIHDSTYFEDLKRKHTTFKDVLKIAKQANVQKLVLTHISRRYNDIRKLKEIVEKYPSVVLAKDFMQIHL